VNGARRSAFVALLASERLDDDGSVGGGEAAEVVGVGRLDLAAAAFHGDRDRMGVREQRGARARLGEQRSDEASQTSVCVAEQQPVLCLARDQRVNRCDTRERRRRRGGDAKRQ